MYRLIVAHPRPPPRPSKRPSKAPAASEPSRTSRPLAEHAAKAASRRPPSEVEPAGRASDMSEQSAKVRPPYPTIEVEADWIDVTETVGAAEDAAAAASSARKTPPRLPGAPRTLPPMPVSSAPTECPPSPRHRTIEVEMNWLELVEEAKRKRSAADEGSSEAEAKTPARRTGNRASSRSPRGRPK